MVTAVAFITADKVQVQSTYERAKVKKRFIDAARQLKMRPMKPLWQPRKYEGNDVKMKTAETHRHGKKIMVTKGERNKLGVWD